MTGHNLDRLKLGYKYLFNVILTLGEMLVLGQNSELPSNIIATICILSYKLCIVVNRKCMVLTYPMLSVPKLHQAQNS